MSDETTVRGVLLDIDGTLMDSNEAHAQAWAAALAEGGYTTDIARVRHLIGMGADNLLPEATGLSKDCPDGKRIAAGHDAIFEHEYLSKVQPFPQAREMIARMHTEGLRLVVATSSPRKQLDILLERIGITDLLDDTASGDDAEHSKPDPDIVALGLGKTGLPAAAVLMLGDAPYDIAAADKLGIRTIALRSGGFSDRDLAGALAIYDDPADLLARYKESPLATD